MERDRAAPAQSKILILRLIKAIVWVIALIFGGLGLSVGYYALTLNERLADKISYYLSHATTFNVTLGPVESDMRAGVIRGGDLRFVPDWGHIDRIEVTFNPKGLKNIGVIPIEKLRVEGGAIKHWGKLGMLRPCGDYTNLHTPQSLNITINQIEWVHVTRETKLPWPEYLESGPLNLYFSNTGVVCLVSQKQDNTQKAGS